MTKQEINELLYAAADEEYKKFNARIVNSNYKMIGVRAPQIKELAKKIARDPGDFFDEPDNSSYESVLLYTLAVACLKAPIERKLDLLDKVLPLFDSWAHVDMGISAFKDLAKHRDLFLERYAYLVNAPEFMRRTMVVFLMDFCLTPEYLSTVFDLYTKMQCDAYYVNMGIAWGLSVALVKFYEPTLEFLKTKPFNEFIMKKTVQKARESFRITAEQKAELKSLL